MGMVLHAFLVSDGQLKQEVFVLLECHIGARMARSCFWSGEHSWENDSVSKCHYSEPEIGETHDTPETVETLETLETVSWENDSVSKCHCSEPEIGETLETLETLETVCRLNSLREPV